MTRVVAIDELAERGLVAGPQRGDEGVLVACSALLRFAPHRGRPYPPASGEALGEVVGDPERVGDDRQRRVHR